MKRLLMKRAFSEPAFCQRGSTMLTALASIGGGLLFTLLLANLVRYVAATNAVQQAAEKTARCITPTDPDCITLTAQPVDTLVDWFAATPGTRQQTWVNRYNYSARMYRQVWEASYPVWAVHKVPLPEVSYQSYQAPVKTFQPKLNSYEYRTAKVVASYSAFVAKIDTFLRPAYEPNFPDYDNDHEDTFKNVAADQWWPGAEITTRNGRRQATEYQRIELGGLGARTTNWIEHRIAHGDAIPFASEWFAVPALPSTTLGYCETTDGKACDISKSTGDKSKGTPRPWTEVGHIAVKAFGEFRKAPNQDGAPQAHVGWKGSPERGIDGASLEGWGLEVNTLSPEQYAEWQAKVEAAVLNGLPAPAEPQGFKTRCLGGRDFDAVPSQSWKDYHLVLRGVYGSPGPGDYAVCPRKDRDHWDIQVERGGAYQIRAWIWAKDADVSGRVKFWHYVDSYTVDNKQSFSPQNETCEGSVQLRPGVQLSDCPAREACKDSLPSNAHVDGNCSVSIERTPVCVADPANDPFAFPIPPANCGSAIKAVTCGDWSPSVEATCPDINANSNRKVCGWSETSSGLSADLPGDGASCPGAAASPNETACGDGRVEVTFQPDGDYGNVKNCPEVSRLQDILASNAAKLAAAQPPGAPQVSTSDSPSFRWADAKEFTPPRWVLQQNQLDERGEQLSHPDQIREERDSVTNNGAIYKHTDAAWQPNLTYFPLSEHFLSGRQLTLTSTREEVIEFTEGYPFEHRPEFQIPDFLPTEQSLSSCQGEPVSLEDRLRAYAGDTFPPALDKSLVFEVNEEKIDEALVQASDSCNQAAAKHIAVPACTKVASSTTEPTLCYPGQYLGRYGSGSDDALPAACRDGALENCYAQAVVSEQEEVSPTSQLNLAVAQNRGYSEIARALPGTSRNCSGAGCASIQITGENDLLTTVSVRYQMPITFPFSTILGKDSLTIERSNQEVRELAAVGRFAGGQHPEPQ